ncbi:MAG TPA: M13 family metallopeptidase [Chthoniobacterales bacterium]|nr:M13 family metallopeptidase [Chthoniobacterales bacterium]
MFKPTYLLLTGLIAAGNLFGQTDPSTSLTTTEATKPPAVRDPAKPSAEQSPPPAIPAESSATKSTDKGTLDENPPAFDVNNMDTSVKPQDDFYTYANGGWLKKTPIPPEESRWGSFNQLIEKNTEALRVVAEKASKAPAKGKPNPEVRKVGDYYASGMDEATIEAAKATPLADEFKRIDAMKDRGDVLKEIAHLHNMGVGAFFGFTSGQDDKNSTMVIGQAYQGGLGMPDRDYYTKDDEAMKKMREQYVAHVTKMLTLSGEPAADAAEHAKKILALETSLAVPARTRVELRDPQKNYNKMKQSELQQLTPDWKWADYFKEIKLAAPGDINVGQPDFFKAANQVFANTSIDDWKIYLRWHLIHAAAAELSSEFVNEDFRFFGNTLTGAKQLKPRWKRVVTSTDQALGEALGKLYVADNFPPESKARMIELVKNIREAMADSIKSRDWMDEPTKQEALKKLAAFTVKIGYPDKWRDYSALKIDKGPFVLNAARASTFEVARQLRKIGKPVDRSEWGMTPPTVNAYYNPNMNEIVFPAGILQPPFFNAKADDAINYGGIGAVIAHEISHGFDDQGRQFDATGNLRDWWTPESAAKYKERADKIVQQYAEYEPLPGMHINGQLTQGENIADDGGVKLAYAALQKALAKKGGKSEKIDGFTPEQRFFLGWAQVWRANIRDEALKLRLNTDPHSPTKYRCNGPLSNTPEFQKAFDLPDGSPMVRPPDKRVSIW